MQIVFFSHNTLTFTRWRYWGVNYVRPQNIDEIIAWTSHKLRNCFRNTLPYCLQMLVCWQKDHQLAYYRGELLRKSTTKEGSRQLKEEPGLRPENRWSAVGTCRAEMTYISSLPRQNGWPVIAFHPAQTFRDRLWEVGERYNRIPWANTAVSFIAAPSQGRRRVSFPRQVCQ